GQSTRASQLTADSHRRGAWRSAALLEVVAMPRLHDQHTQRSSGASVLCSGLMIIGLLIYWTPVLAHHGGLGIEGDLVQWALKVDQWQDENIAHGHRIKFLSYPRQPIVGNSIRLVFEIQSTATRQYVSGL